MSYIWDVVFSGNGKLGYNQNHTPHITTSKKFQRKLYDTYSNDMKIEFKHCYLDYLYRQSEWKLNEMNEMNEISSEILNENFSKKIHYLREINKLLI